MRAGAIDDNIDFREGVQADNVPRLLERWNGS